MVFQKQERLSSAEYAQHPPPRRCCHPTDCFAACRYHFRRAREINPRNSGLDAQLGTILLEKDKSANLDEARELLER
jgi:hypothetical protein